MTRVLVLYNQPADPAAFDRYYFAAHVPLAKTMPGLRSYIVNAAPASVIVGDKPPHLIAELEFDTHADVLKALESEEGKATASDLANFAQAGVTILSFDMKSL